MGKKTQYSIDGFPVDQSRARFSNTFDVVDGDTKYLAADEEVVLLVVARVNSVRFASNKDGDHVRINALKVQEARLIRKEDEKTELLETYDFEYIPGPSLVESVEVEAKTPKLAVRFKDADEVEEEVTEAINSVEGDAVPSDEVEEETPVTEDEDERQIREWLDEAKRIADKYDDEPEEFEPYNRGESRIVGEAKGLAEVDPILKNFLSV